MRIVVGLSGGVDSSVSAKLLLDQGHEVIGVFLKNWNDEDHNCPAIADAAQARQIAAKLSIPFYLFDFSEEYWRDVFANFLSENKVGRTPNPDILCNKYIKFGVFLEKAKELNADMIATGHYAKKVFNETSQAFELCMPADKNKDQTYFLHALSQQQLARSIFPLENFTKTKVRKLAKKYGFQNAERKDSTGICFIGEKNYFQFLSQYFKPSPGDIVTPDGKIVGAHQGLCFYTIGQRKNLHIGGVKGAQESPWFVVAKVSKENKLIVSQDEDLLLSKTLHAGSLTWISGELPDSLRNVVHCKAQIRYRQSAENCELSLLENGTATVIFTNPQRAIAPGQSVVFYLGEVCLGGGVILD